MRYLRGLAILTAVAAAALSACGRDLTPRGNGDAGADSPQQGDATALADGMLVLDKSTVNLGTRGDDGYGVSFVTVTNTSNAPSGPITITASPGVTTQGCDGAVLLAGASCTITITTTSTAPAPFTGTVWIAANPGAITPLQVFVIGTEGLGLFFLSPGAIELGAVEVGVPAPKQVITVTAGISLTDLTVASSGPDVTIDWVATTCTTTLAANASCTVVVDFVAAATGSRSDAIVISAGGAAGRMVTVPITAVVQTRAGFSINPNTAVFTATAGLTSSAITFAVVNGSNIATGLLNVSITGANAANFNATSNCLVLAPLSACTISVTYTPSTVITTADTANLVVSDTSVGGYVVTVPLTGIGASAANLVITPTSGDLGTVLVGQAGPSTVFTVTNTGDTASGNLTLALSSTEFIITNDTCTGASLVGNTGTCTISVAFKPVSCSTKSATLTVAGTNGSLCVKTLTGLPFTPTRLGAAPSAVDFGSVRVNRTSAAQTVTAKLNGCGGPTGPLSFAKAGSFGEFSMTANTCSAALNQGESCTFVLVFAPTAAGSQTASFTLEDGAVSATVLVSGNGLAPVPVTLSPSGGVFPDTTVGQKSASVTFTLTNSSPSGVDAGAIDAGASATDETGAIDVSLAGSDPSDFQITSNGCAASLPPQATCEIAVAFTPHATSSHAAEIAVTTDNGGLATAALSGTGI